MNKQYSQIKSIHEEQYSDGSKTLGMLVNYTDDDSLKESFLYIFDHKRAMYIFFNTIIDMIDYLMWNDSKVKRAYMEEKEFDTIFDAEFIEGRFIEKLTWIS